MKVVLAQTDIVWADPESNREKARKVLASHPGADLVVFPEMFSTGFATKPQDIAEEDPSATLEWMKASAAAFNTAIAGSVALHKDGTFLNRFYFVKPDGEVTFYDKHHLFTYGGEPEFFTAGDRQVTVEWKGWKFRLVVCYDLRFPLWCRNNDGYDALICVASWPKPRRRNWDALLRARAIEDQCYVLGVNRTGADPACVYTGGTVIIDPYGEYISTCADECECECEAELELEPLQEFRKKFPVLLDADRFEMND